MPKERGHGIQWTGGWIGPRGGLDACPCLESNPGHPAHSLFTILTDLPWEIFKTKSSKEQGQDRATRNGKMKMYSDNSKAFRAMQQYNFVEQRKAA
jgi:hypothetical protein